MRRLLALLLPLLAAACSSTDWKLVGAASHPALREGAELIRFERGRGGERETRVDIRTPDGTDAAATVEETMRHVRPIDTREAAIAYADLVRELGLTDAGARGLSVRPDPALTGPGGSGRYSRSDAAAWGIDFEPASRLNAGGFEISHVVLLPPVPHAVLPSATPWRLVLLREIVFPDGTLRALDERTLTNGHDARRFAPR